MTTQLSGVRACASQIGSVYLAGMLVLSLSAHPAGIIEKPPFTVRNSIEWTHVLPFSSTPITAGQRVALFSPDGSRFVVHSRHGDLARNVNVHSLWLFGTRAVENYGQSTSQVSDPPTPLLLANVDAAKDEDALGGIQWLSDSMVGFVANPHGGRKQAFAVDIATRSLTQLTDSDTNVVAFAKSGATVVYYACVRQRREQPLVVSVDSFETALQLREPNDSGCFLTTPIELFVKAGSQPSRKIALPAVQLLPQLQRIWLSPSGEHAIVLAPATNAPAHWADYTGPYSQQLGFAPQWVRDDPTSPDLLGRTRYLVVDVRSGTVRPLLDAPTGQMALNRTPFEALWLDDGRSVVVSNTFLPLQEVDRPTREHRTRQPAIAEVNIVSGEIIPVAWEAVRPNLQTPLANPIVGFDWDYANRRLTVRQQRSPDGGISRSEYTRGRGDWTLRLPLTARASRSAIIEQRQSLNQRPKLYVVDGNRHKVLFDPNPQANELSFGQVRVVEWSDMKEEKWTGGMVLPPIYVPGTRYPLVVQTHGFDPSRFLMDGPNDGEGGGTAFAAQALANAGFVVLQVQDNPRAMTQDDREGPAVAEGFRSGIARLVADNLVDPSRVGLIAFSRTGWPALHLVAKNPDLLAAMVMSDSLNIGYGPISYNATNPSIADELAKLAGGRIDFSDAGRWFSNNPLYALGRSRPAIRLEGMGHGLAMWETYALVRDANRPVDFLLYPDGSHVLQKPLERLSSQGGSLDWFRFWLQNYEDPDPVKQQQYERWRRLRALTPR